MKNMLKHTIILLALGLINFTLNASEKISFNDQIRPLLAENCFNCHGPDAATRKAKLRLDIEAEAKAKLPKTGSVAIVPGKPDMSAIIERMKSDDLDEVMPPPKTKLKMKKENIELISRWIKEGAEWQKHWAFVAPKKHQSKTEDKQKWSKNEIDPFILAELNKRGLSSNAEASKETLLRRVTFDLTGLPPTLEELDAYLNEPSDDAYEKVVDKLLASNAYGERMASEWLDVARYGDTDGLFEDHPRKIHPWRDWVVQAFNDNLPYNEFIRWQVAGDLIPNATREQKIATGFLRNNVTSNEGGIIDEDYRIKYLVDRVNTTATAFLGLSFECAQCHDHKFDPMTRKEYYEFAGFFNNLVGKGNTKGATAPTLVLRTPEDEKRLKEIEEAIKRCDQDIAKDSDDLKKATQAWVKDVNEIPWQIIKFEKIDRTNPKKKQEKKDELKLNLGDKEISALRFLPGKDKDEVLKDFLISKITLTVNPKVGIKAKPRGIAIQVAFASSELRGHPAKDSFRGRNIHKHGWAPSKGSKGQYLQLVLKQPLKLKEGETLVMHVHQYNQSRKYRLENFQIEFSEDKKAIELHTLANKDFLAVNNAKKQSQTPDKNLLNIYRKIYPGYKKFRDQKQSLSQEKNKIKKRDQLTMIAADGKARKNYMLERGEYDKRGEEVQTAAIGSIYPYDTSLPANRLSLASWITDSKHPLTARVVVNRYWQMIFGVGIVKTSEDLGSQGDRPTHEALLDTLAVQFVESGWNVKALIKKMLMSATYRQSSISSDQKNKIDPENRYYSHASRSRLQAEFLRDHALMTSGQLNRKMGGPGVYPYQPASLYGKDSLGGAYKGYKQSKGTDLHRRSLYTYLRRQIVTANMRILGADGRTVCRTRREKTNTPLQALVLLNDPQFVEAARMFAERIMKSEQNDEKRIANAFRLATSRQIHDAELKILVQELNDRRKYFKTNPKKAAEFIQVGDGQADKSMNIIELAAYSAVCSLILNLDEAQSKS